MFNNTYYSETDLEEILRDIRRNITEYKKNKHTLSRIQVQDIRDDLSVLRTQLADIGADLYGDKIETAAKYDKQKAEAEERIEGEFRASKAPNAADRSKRLAKIEVSTAEMLQADKINKLATNLYQFSLQDVVNSLSSRILVLREGESSTVSKSAKDLGHEGPDSFDELHSILQAEKDAMNLEREIHE